MAQPIQYTPPPPRIETTAEEELQRLLQTCHEHGVLRLANDLVASNTEVAQVLINGLQKQGTLNAIQNVAVLFMALSRIPPDQFYRIVFALQEGIATLTAAPPREQQQQPPGLTGAYHMLHDEQLWQALTPLVEALKVFATDLHKRVENPISDFSGKTGRPS